MPRQKSTHVDSAAAVGSRIRRLREERGLRQRDLAFEGCTPAYISRIEAGVRIPSLQILREIGKRLRVSADYLATGSEPVKSSEALALADAQLEQRLGETEKARSDFAQLANSDEPEIRRGALLGSAQLALERGEVSEAIELLEEHETLAEGEPVDPAVVEALAHAYSTRGDLAAALALVERQLARVDEDPVTRFRLTVTLTNILIDLGHLDRAEALVGDELAKLGSAPDTVALARCLWSQSRLQTARGNNDLAADYAEQALALIKSTEHEEYAARAHLLLAYIELERGHPEQALSLINDALPLVERGGDQPLLAIFRVDQARALADLGRLDEAREIAADLVRQREGLGRVDSARALAVLAGIFAKTGEIDQALDLYAAAADELADRQDAPMLVDVYSRWSDLLAETGDTQRALEVARRALTARQPRRQPSAT